MNLHFRNIWIDVYVVRGKTIDAKSFGRKMAALGE